ncbi:hypothetical protein M3231_15430 [Neobacillus mesonae]|nr:hypothetical protein [Neobacillus mesonae]
MNRDQITAKWNEMAPRERDAWVAELFFGWTRNEVARRTLILPPDNDPRRTWAAMWDEYGCPHWLPPYTTEIFSAWTVIEMFYEYEVSKSEGHYVVYITMEDGYVRVPTRNSAPEAICLAAIIAKLTVSV